MILFLNFIILIIKKYKNHPNNFLMSIFYSFCIVIKY